MNKKKTLITLIIIAVIGSFVAFYASNLFFNDVLNFAVGFSRMTILASLPALMIGAMFVTATLYLVRLYKRPKTTKRLSKTYSFIFMALSFVGFITALLAGLLTYKSFVKPYPFPGYLLIALILNLLILGGTVFVFIRFVLKLKDDEETFKVTPKHVFHTLGLFLLIALAYNRFGGFLFMPFYVELRNFNETFVMYLYLLIPMALLVYKAIMIFELRQKMLIYVATVGALNIILLAVIIIIAVQDSAFISAVSPLMPLERLAAKPVEIFIHFFAYLGVSIYYLVSELKKVK